MQVYIATYITTTGDSFAAMNMKDIYSWLEEEHGGREISTLTASNQCGRIEWEDDLEKQFAVHFVTAPLVGMDDKPRYLSRLAEPVDVYVATRANIDYWAGEVNNECEEGSHEHIVYAGEIKLCVDKYTGKVK